MTNKEAIKILDNLKPGDYSNPYEKGEAIVMAISALQEQDSPKPKAESVQNVQNEDLISRKAAIDAECEVCQIAPKKERGHNCTYYVHGCKEIECLRALPSAQPETIRCRDCLMHEVCRFEQWLGLNGYCSQAERRTDA